MHTGWVGRGLFLKIFCLSFLFVVILFLYLFLSVIPGDCTLYKFVRKNKKIEKKKFFTLHSGSGW